MRPTLFHIPHEWLGVPVFGVGWALAVVVLGGAALVLLLARRQGFRRETLSYLPVLAAIAAAVVWLLPRLEESLPDGTPLGVPIRGYGVMLLLGIVSGVLLAAHRARRVGVDPEIIFSLAFWSFLAGILGARLFFVIEYWPQFVQPTLGQTVAAVLNIAQGGLVFYGSLVGGVGAALVFVAVRRLPMLALLDLVAPSLMLGLALGRLGCLLNGCCYGGLCEAAWAVQFPPGSPPFAAHQQEGLFFGFHLGEDAAGEVIVARVREDGPAAAAGLRGGEQIAAIQGVPLRDAASDPGSAAAATPLHKARNLLGGVREEVSLLLADGRTLRLALPEAPRWSLPVHPTQVYAAINALLIFFLLLAWEPFRRRDGELTALTLTVYPVSRFLIEVIRTDEASFLGTGLTVSQNVSLGLLVVAAALWWYLLFRAPRGLAWTRAAGQGR